MKDPELIIEQPPFDEPISQKEAQPQENVTQSAEAEPAEGQADGAGWTDEQGDEGKRKSKKAEALKHLKEQASEDDEAPIGTLTLRQIVGGDYLLALVRHYVWFIVLVVLLTCVYVGVRYQCQQDVIEISRLEKELIDAKFRAMSSSSNLTELCRQSNVLKVLRENEDNELVMPEQPPYIIPVESNK